MNTSISEKIVTIVVAILFFVAGLGGLYYEGKTLLRQNELKQMHLTDLEYQYQHAVFEKRHADIQIMLGEDEAILQMIEAEHKLVAAQTPVKCLTDNIYYESGFEIYEGQLAVAQVTLNRAHENPSKICKVVYFKKVNPNTGKKEAAFSWTLGRKWKPHGINRAAYKECALLARAVLTNHLRSDIIDSSVIMYHAAYIAPKWKNNYEMVAQIGAHIFYR